MTKYVRVKRPNGSAFTTTAEHARRAGLTVIKGAPTHDRFGRIIPPTPAKAAPKAAAPKAAPPAAVDKKEGAK